MDIQPLSSNTNTLEQLQINDNNIEQENIYHFLIEEMIKASASIKEYIDNKNYLTMDDDEVTPEKVAMVGLTILLDELKEVGVTYEVDEFELQCNMAYIKLIIINRYLVDPVFIIPLLQDKEINYNDIFELISTGGQDVTKQYLEYCFENRLVDNLHLHSAVIDIDYTTLTDYIINTQRFTDHMETILNTFTPTPHEVEETSDDLYFKLLPIVEQDRINFKLAVNKLIENGFIDKIPFRLKKRIEEYDLQKIQGIQNTKDKTDEDAKHYWVWTIQKNDPSLTDRMKKIQQDIFDIHHETNDHHIEYYLTKYIGRIFSFLEEDLIALVCHHYHPNITRDEMRNEMERMENLGQALFTEANKHYMLEIATILMKGHH